MATAETKLSMKLLIDTKNKKVLFAEVEKGFVDFLFHILTLPVGTVTKLLNERGMNECLNNIYESVENLDIQSKHIILEPKCPLRISSVPLPLLNDIPTLTDLYKCSYHSHFCGFYYATDDPNAKCTCGRSMSIRLTHVTPDVMKYLVMDDLVVKPVSFVSSITGLNKYFNVKDVSALHEEVVHFGKEEALKLLKLSFESKAVLTSVYMSSVIMNRTKRVLFAEVEKDFVDFLFHILTLPVGIVTKLLIEKGMNGCLHNIYESVENLNDTYIESKHIILKPECPPGISSVPLYRCASSISTCSSASDDPTTICKSCNFYISRKLTYVAPPAVKKGGEIHEYYNVKDVGVSREEVVDFGMEEALKLLKSSFDTKAVLTKAEKDCVDFLFHILSLPLSTVIRLLKKKGLNYGCLPNLYESVENLNDTYIQSNQDKYILLKPKSPVGIFSVPFLALNDVPVQKTSYVCAYYCDAPTYVTDDPNSLCPNCRNHMTRKLTYLVPHGLKEPVATTGTGFVKEAVKYMVMDDLAVKPISVVSSITALNKYFNVKDVGSLHEKVVNLGMEEALKLLKASFESKTVLTSVFMSGAKRKRSSKHIILEHKCPHRISSVPHILLNNDIPTLTDLYRCSSYPYPSCGYYSVTDDPNVKCSCGHRMSSRCKYVAPPALKECVVATGLNKYFNVKDISALHEEVVHFGKEEALKLLKLSFESKAVLTSVYMSSVIMNQAEKNCVDFLFLILSLPVTTVIKLLKKKGMNYGCLPKLYDSVENLNDTYIQSKDILLKPKSSLIGISSIPFLSIDDVPTTHKTFYSCSSSNHYNHLTVSDDPSARCTCCQSLMSRKLTYVAPPIASGAVASTSGFVKDVVTYMVIDDLVIKPMSTISSITLLNKFNVKDVGVLQEEVVNFGMEEALKLLKASFESKTVLTKPTKLSMKLLIDTKAGKVLFAEAEKDCVDFLFHILSLPVGTVVRLLKEKGMNWCLHNLYQSVENLNDTYMKSNEAKNILLKPKSSIEIVSSVPLQLLKYVLTTQRAPKSYKCTNSCCYFVTNEYYAYCSECDEDVVRRSTINVAPPAATSTGFVTYMVMDDLVIKPMSTISSITLLNKFNVEDVAVLHEKVVHFGMEEALKLLKASFESKAVLTSNMKDNVNADGSKEKIQ
ncbi:hypothetical protein H5410_033672, partial [Solanum commersonii]